MGIDVNGKIVTYNPDHQQRVDTDTTRLPPHYILDGLTVVSVFRRKTVRRDNSDGNPLIHALKGNKGYTISSSDFRQILKCASTILPAALATMEYDLVAPLPSSSLIATIFAKRAARLRNDCPIVHCFEKASFGQVLATASPAVNVESRRRKAFKAQLAALQRADPDDIFQMKQVDFALREYFNPVTTNVLSALTAGRHVLLVDDILGSGSSMRAACQALQGFAPARVTGLTFLGQLE